MTELTRPIRRLLHRTDHDVVPTTAVAAAVDTQPGEAASVALDIPENDALLAYLQSAQGPVEVGRIELDSVALRGIREDGVALIVPLVSQGEPIGTLNLRPRRSEQEYSSELGPRRQPPERPLLGGDAGEPGRSCWRCRAGDRYRQGLRRQSPPVAVHPEHPLQCDVLDRRRNRDRSRPLVAAPIRPSE